MKRICLSIFVGVFTIFSLLLIINHRRTDKATDHSKIGWITDIHAGDKKNIERESGNIVYPRSFRVYFSTALEKMKSKGISIVIVTGDIIDSEKEYRTELEDIAAKYGMNAIWVNGNHDKYEIPLYYTADYGSWRIIVLDSNQMNNPKATGGIDEKQMEWLAEEIDKSNRPIIIAMHHTIFDEVEHALYPEYQDFKKIIEEKQKVKIVISGHLHKEYFQEENGIKYFSGDLLNRDHRLNYYIIDLDSLNASSYN